MLYSFLLAGNLKLDYIYLKKSIRSSVIVVKNLWKLNCRRVRNNFFLEPSYTDRELNLNKNIMETNIINELMN